MKITLNEVDYIAPTPVTGLWFAIQKMKTEQGKRVEEIKNIWDKIEPFDKKKDLDSAAEKELNSLIALCAKKTDDNKQILLESKIKIIVDAFANQNVTQETILQYILLQDIDSIFFEINKLLNDILAGRTAQLPNDQTPIA